MPPYIPRWCICLPTTRVYPSAHSSLPGPLEPPRTLTFLVIPGYSRVIFPVIPGLFRVCEKQASLRLTGLPGGPTRFTVGRQLFLPNFGLFLTVLTKSGDFPGYIPRVENLSEQWILVISARFNLSFSSFLPVLGLFCP